MKMLEALQNAFYTAIFQKESESHEFISSSYSAERFTVYRQTIYDNLSNALALTFPGVWKLIGSDCANSLAYAFCKLNKNLPSTNCLDDWGNQFPDFITQQQELSSLAYLPDYARYEWLKHQSYCAPSAAAIEAATLQTIPEEIIESISFTFLPSVFMLAADFPLDEIETIVENPNAEAIKLSTNKTYAIIARPKNTVLTYWVDASLWTFIHAMEQSMTLEQAFQKTQEHDPDFDLTQALHFVLYNGLIAKIL